MEHEPTCIFCDIVCRKAEASVVYEDERIMAFMTLRPVNPGEFLIIPKEQIDHFSDIPDDLACHIMVHAQRLSRNLSERLHPRAGPACEGIGLNVGDICIAG